MLRGYGTTHQEGDIGNRWGGDWDHDDRWGGDHNGIINSSTKCLPHWFELLVEHDLPHCIMPWNVAIHWNSTYNLCNFSLTYQYPIDEIAVEQGMGLCKYELEEADWLITEQL